MQVCQKHLVIAIASVFHEEDNEDIDKETKEKNQLDTYIQYGKKLEEIISNIAI